MEEKRKSPDFGTEELVEIYNAIDIQLKELEKEDLPQIFGKECADLFRRKAVLNSILAKIAECEPDRN